MAPRFFKYTLIIGASGSKRDRKQYITVQGAVATFWEPKDWVEIEVYQKVYDVYSRARARWSRHMYGVTEVDGYEIEEIESHEAPGFYYLVISLNDSPVERWKLTRAGVTKMPLDPAVKGGYGRIRNFLSSAVNLLRGLVGF